MRVHREIKRETGCLTLRAIFDVGYVLRAFRVGLADGLAGRYLFSGKLWSERQDWRSGLITIEIACVFQVVRATCVLTICTPIKQSALYWTDYDDVAAAPGCGVRGWRCLWCLVASNTLRLVDTLERTLCLGSGCILRGVLHGPEHG
jgi:hypothetical protein